MKRALTVVLCVILAGVAIFSGYQVVAILSDYRTGEKTYDDIRQFVEVSPPVTPQPAATEPTVGETQLGETLPATQLPTVPADNTVWPVVDFGALKAINPDVVAWIYLEGTNINYPVLRGSDNDYYLRAMIDGSYNRSGSIFMDYRNAPDFSDKHTIIHGHNMNNGAMFADLVGYKEQSFYDSHPVCLIMTPEKNYKMEIFAGYVADERGNSWELSFDTDEALEEWLQMSIESSCFVSPVTPTAQDRIITLSTCSYEYYEARFVLVGVLK